MPREDISFKTGDGVTLRGHLYMQSGQQEPDIHRKLPCLVLCHGLSCVKEQVLPQMCEALISQLRIACLVFDYRGFGSSETLPGVPRFEIIPSIQISDIQDAVTYAQSRTDIIDSTMIGLWGYSYGAGHSLYLGAVDRRVKAVISHGPPVDGWTAWHRLVRPDMVSSLEEIFEADRIGRAKGEPAMTVPVVDPEPFASKALPSKESWDFFSSWIGSSSWENKVTVRTLEHIRAYNLPLSHISHIGPTPVFMSLAKSDTNTASDMGLKAYTKLSEPKELLILDATHYSMLEKSELMERQVDFIKKTLCKDF
ncbi:MAG: hypothetical protein Q9227_001094 [Pyrenula ochraceoflavens]